jgi:magnesium transporter
MTSLKTFYLSRLLGKNVFDPNGRKLGRLKDLLIDTVPTENNGNGERPRVAAVRMRVQNKVALYDIKHFEFIKEGVQPHISCSQLDELPEEMMHKGILLAEVIMDKQIVDLNGRKLVRVNDVRLVNLPSGMFAIAVDVGFEGLLRRIGISLMIKQTLGLFRLALPSRFILWDDVEAIDFSNFNIRLSKSHSKLHTLHPSDLADIMEEMGRHSRTSVFSALDEEKAADVLEELEPHAQIHIIESLPLGKAADVLEKMPANEAADLLDELEEDKAEMLLAEMEKESSEEVRELLEYPDNTVGSLMNTEILSFNEFKTASEIIDELRSKKPEAEELYNLFVTNSENELIATFSLRDLVIAHPETALHQFMKTDPVFLIDDQHIGDIAETISRYNLLAIPVVDQTHHLEGMVVIDDVIEDLIDKGRTNR